MRKKLIYESQKEHSGYGAGSGDIEHYEYECPCGIRKNNRRTRQYSGIPRP